MTTPANPSGHLYIYTVSQPGDGINGTHVWPQYAVVSYDRSMPASCAKDADRRCEELRKYGYIHAFVTTKPVEGAFVCAAKSQPDQ